VKKPKKGETTEGINKTARGKARRRKEKAPIEHKSQGGNQKTSPKRGRGNLLGGVKPLTNETGG